MAFVVNSLTGAFTLAFVVSSMFGLGLGLSVREMLQPLANLGLVARVLVVNFVIVPGIAWIFTGLLPLDQNTQIGLLLMGAVAGAPLALKATQIARGDVKLGVGIVTLQVLSSVIYLPLVLPRLFRRIAVDAVALAMPLVLQILLPLAFGLFMRTRYDEEAEMARPIMSEVSSLSLVALLVLNLVNIKQVLRLAGSPALVAIIGVVVLGLVAGYLLGGPGQAPRRAMAFCTAHRNYAAAFVIAEDNFADRPEVMLMLLSAALISLVIILVVAGEIGRRGRRSRRSREPFSAASQGTSGAG